jgi:hypothetical protein
MLSHSGTSGNSTNGRTGQKRPRVQFGPPTGQPVKVQMVQLTSVQTARPVTVQTVQPVQTPPTPKPQATGGGENKQFPSAA